MAQGRGRRGQGKTEFVLESDEKLAAACLQAHLYALHVLYGASIKNTMRLNSRATLAARSNRDKPCKGRDGGGNSLGYSGHVCNRSPGSSVKFA